jgi:hypothetical protein
MKLRVKNRIAKVNITTNVLIIMCHHSFPINAEIIKTKPVNKKENQELN